MNDKFAVTYLEHSIFHDAERKTEIVSKARLVELLHMGMISVLDARLIIS